jgi:large subunit ribosomal protein L1
MARKFSKRVKALRSQVDREAKHSLSEACEVLKTTSNAKFDETVDIAVRLGVNPRHADQMVRGAVVLPHGTGQSVRVAVFAKGDKAKEAEEAGADIVGDADLVERVQGGFLEFDRVIASPDMMGQVGKLGRVLGPRGLMPNPKVGTVTPNIRAAVEEAKAGKIQYRVERAGIVHARIGKASFDASKLAENANALLTQLVRQKPATAKGTYMRSITLSSTMGVGVRVDTAEFSGKTTEV